MNEVLNIYHKKFPLKRITVARNVFIFAAFAGVAFIDVQQLSPEHIVKTTTESHESENEPLGLLSTFLILCKSTFIIIR